MARWLKLRGSNDYIPKVLITLLKASAVKEEWDGQESQISKLVLWRIHETPILAWKYKLMAFKCEIKGPLQSTHQAELFGLSGIQSFCDNNEGRG